MAHIYNEGIRSGQSTMDTAYVGSERFDRYLFQPGDRESLIVCERNDRVVGLGIIKRYSEREGYHFACASIRVCGE